MGGEPPPGYSSGGMRTKLVAARIATQAGCAMAIALGSVANPLRRCATAPAAPGSCRRPRAAPRASAGSPAPAAAGRAHRRRRRGPRAGAGRSLLPAGVRGVDGAFDRGDAVEVRGPGRRQLAPRPVRLFGSDDARDHRRPPLREIEALLGWRGRDEAIHRDDLVLL